MDPTITVGSREARFTALYDAAYVDLLRFVRRRANASQAEDIVGDVMLVAWRRLDHVPSELSDARAWLFGVARKTLQNTRRHDGRQDAIAVRLAEGDHGSTDAEEMSDAVAARLDIAAAWPRLSALHQEALALAILEGLGSQDAARVLGISPTAFRIRLSRARGSLRRLIASQAHELPPRRPADSRSPR